MGGSIVSGADEDAARVGGGDTNLTTREQPHHLGQDLVLDRVQLRPDVVGLTRVLQLHGTLDDHRPRIDAAVGEVHRHPEDGDAVGERLIDRVDAGNAGNSDGWTLITASGKRSRISSVTTCM